MSDRLVSLSFFTPSYLTGRSAIWSAGGGSTAAAVTISGCLLYDLIISVNDERCDV
jgi:hypothetical protein